MIPYLPPPPPPLEVFGLRVPVFGLLVLAALIVVYALIVARGRRLADGALAERFAQVILLSGVVGAHAGGVLADHGARALSRPSLFLSTDSAFSSAAGFVLAAAAGALFLRLTRRDLRLWADVAAFALPFGMLIARAGCALSHDHLGRPSTSWLAVRFPGGARFDCGLLEWMAAPLLVALAVMLARRPLQAGRLAGAVGIGYSLIRFGLDFLRAADIPGADRRFLTLTLAQWICILLAAVCGHLAVRRVALQRPRHGA